MNKFFIYLSYLTIISALGLMSVLLFWYFYPYKIAEFRNLPFPVLNENAEVKRGERLRYLIEYCKYTDISPMLTKYFIDGVIYETPKVPSVVPEGCGQIVSDVYVSKAIPAGQYSLKIIAEYKVNPIRTIQFINYTQPFTVK